MHAFLNSLIVEKTVDEKSIQNRTMQFWTNPYKIKFYAISQKIMTANDPYWNKIKKILKSGIYILCSPDPEFRKFETIFFS